MLPVLFIRDTKIQIFTSYLSLAALHNDQLLLRGRSGKHDLSVVFQDVVELLWGQILQVASVHDTGLCVSGQNKKVTSQTIQASSSRL